MTARCLFLLSSLAFGAAQPQPFTWTPQSRPLFADAEIEVLGTGLQPDPADAGVSWEAPAQADELAIEYVTMGGRAYQPEPHGQRLEYWRDGAWAPLAARVTADRRDAAALAPLQGFGSIRWMYRFAPVTTTRLRVRLEIPAQKDPGQRLYALRGVQVRFSGQAAPAPGIAVPPEPPPAPAWLQPGADLAAAPASRQGVRDGWREVEWPFRVLVNRLAAPAGTPPLTAQWWDGLRWRDVESHGVASPGEARFLPVAAQRYRARSAAGGPPARLHAFHDAEGARYAADLQHSRTDLLHARFATLTNPDLQAMRGLLLPLHFARTAIGRPADEEEWIVNWNGTFLQYEGRFAPEPRDRWFAPAAGATPELFGAGLAWPQTSFRDGYLPATRTVLERDGVRFTQDLLVTAPDDPFYGALAEVTVTNLAARPAATAFTLAMGRRRGQRSPGPRSSPLVYAPEPTGYRWDPASRTVARAGGEVVLLAETAGQWRGTPLENHLVYPLALAPQQTVTLRFFLPDVSAPVRSSGELPGFSFARSAAGFTAWWRRKLTEGMTVDLPEPHLNEIFKNLLAQSLIITRDGEKTVRYGAYFYESYFGIEEGWPAVALAQAGYPREARQILTAMLAPELMDKKNYHHQYRNGLEPWYAITIARLTGGLDWLRIHAPDLEAAAEWTLKVTQENRDPKYAGLLPRHAYGGDISTPAYSFYANATCWRGLRDTALAFRLLGQTEKAARYEREAERYHTRLLEFADGLVDRSTGLPFLPMSFDIGSGGEYREKEPPYAFLGLDTPSTHTWSFLGNYWNLFAPMLLEVKLFAPEDPRSRWIPDYMEQRGGIAAGLVRFTVGLDQIYGKGYYESLLEHGRRDRFWTSLYGVLAHGMSENLYSFPEVAGIWPLRSDNAALWRETQRFLWYWYFHWNWGFTGAQMCEGEPLSAGPGMALQLLRMALVRETVEQPAQDTLRLLDGVPPHWFEPGKRIAFRDAATFYGKVSLEARAARDAIDVTADFAPGFSAREVILRLPRPPRAVTVGGQDAAAVQEVRLPPRGRVQVKAVF